MYLTIRQTAKLKDPRLRGAVSERQLRLMLKEGRLPGVYNGSTFKINVELLAELLEKDSEASILKGGTDQ